MTRFLYGLPLLFLYCSAYAEDAAEVPLEQGGVTGFVIFGILFVVICVGFVWMIIWNDKKQKAKHPQE